MKRLSADDSADSRVKVGHRQATYADTKPLRCRGFCLFRLPNVALVSPVRLAQRPFMHPEADGLVPEL